MVATSCTRNAVVRKGTWVRIPPSPPLIRDVAQFGSTPWTQGILNLLVTILSNKNSASIGMWLSLVEHYVRDVGAAGSNPVIPTKCQNRINT